MQTKIIAQNCADLSGPARDVLEKLLKGVEYRLPNQIELFDPTFFSPGIPDSHPSLAFFQDFHQVTIAHRPCLGVDSSDTISKSPLWSDHVPLVILGRPSSLGASHASKQNNNRASEHKEAGSTQDKESCGVRREHSPLT